MQDIEKGAKGRGKRREEKVFMNQSPFPDSLQNPQHPFNPRRRFFLIKRQKSGQRHPCDMIFFVIFSLLLSFRLNNRTIPEVFQIDQAEGVPVGRARWVPGPIRAYRRHSCPWPCLAEESRP